MTPPSAPCAAAPRRLIPEGQGLDEEFLYFGAVHEQEEGDVEDERQVGQESQRVLA